MVDFRSRLKFPMEAYIKAATAKPNKYDRLSAIVEGVERGLTGGLEMSETVREIRTKRAKAKAYAQFLSSPEGKLAAEESQLPRNLLASLSPEDATTAILKTRTKQGESLDEMLLRERLKTRAREEEKEYFRETAVKRQEDKQIRAEERKKEAKLETLRADIDNFLAIDEKIPRGKGFGRFLQGAKSMYDGLEQDSPEGVAVATHNALAKRLRVSLVRAAGDVGNINIVEQEAAEKILTGIFDSDKVAKVKRTILKELAKAVKNRDSKAVKRILGRAGVSYTDRDLDAKKLQSGNRFEVIE